MPGQTSHPLNLSVRKKDAIWLEAIREQTESPVPRTPKGMREGDLPDGPARRLHALSLIERVPQRNPAYRDRWVITEAGKEYLQQAGRK